MDSKKVLVAAVAIFSFTSAGLIYAANEPAAKFHSAFGMEDPDPDLDGVYTNKDKCNASPFDLWVINKSSKKQAANIEFGDPKNPALPVYLKITKINDKTKDGNSDITVQTSPSEKFAKGTTKNYVLSGGKIITIDSIGKRMKVVYVNSAKGIVILWSAGLEAGKLGCTTND